MEEKSRVAFKYPVWFPVLIVELVTKQKIKERESLGAIG